MLSEEIADFAAVDGLLKSIGASWQAAEAHGAFCGRACLRGVAALQDWGGELSAESDPGNALLTEHIAKLQTVAADTLIKLEAGQMGFAILLPDDSESLQTRTAALADWCHGFMHGLVAGGAGDTGPESDVLETDTTQEILADFSQITRAGAGQGDSEEAEQAFYEVMEYVRVSVQLVYDDTAPFRNRQTASKERG